LAIPNYFILGYFQLCDAIVGYFWLLKVIPPYVIIEDYKLYYYRLFVAVIGYFIDSYCCIFYWWLLVVILLMVINGYFIDDYW